jgi:hypothetical protein
MSLEKSCMVSLNLVLPEFVNPATSKSAVETTIVGFFNESIEAFDIFASL